MNVFNWVGGFVFAPGWTSYNKRLQYQEYDILQLLKDRNRLDVTLGEGWCVGPRLIPSTERFLRAGLEITEQLNILLRYRIAVQQP